MATKAELGKQFLDELVGKLPAGSQDALRTALSSPEATAALELAGSRLSPLDEERQRLDEQRRQLDDRGKKLDDWHNRLGKWKTDTEASFVERDKKLSEREAGGGGGGNPPSNQPPANNNAGAGVTKEDIAKVVEDLILPREAGYVTYVADATRLAVTHLQQFKETLDVAGIVKHPKIAELGFEGVYNLVHKEKLDKLAVEREKAREDAIRADERAKIAAAAPVDMPYPIGEGSPLDALALDPAKRPTGDPAAAAREYERLVAQNAGR